MQFLPDTSNLSSSLDADWASSNLGGENAFLVVLLTFRTGGDTETVVLEVALVALEEVNLELGEVAALETVRDRTGPGEVTDVELDTRILDGELTEGRVRLRVSGEGEGLGLESTDEEDALLSDDVEVEGTARREVSLDASDCVFVATADVADFEGPSPDFNFFCK
ncbi:hypothetical protein PHLCEN_2v9134 [Hermanssonia centrifuga]|uniref:Uncharacterized protein n=1 Tax=Hermanssonia centrifuga TaxID=98765 RepID=A0A2R6NRI9_9APHY|nr:hypothetical protein PHLCEN_2v9134 [Hermanssonia centrifuga]